LYTQNIVCKHYADRILVHGDKDLLPLISDRTRLANSVQIIKDIEPLLQYTGYVCDEDQPIHAQKNNNIYISTGLNKDESVVIFKKIAEIAHHYPDYKFIMPIANKYNSVGGRKNKNIYLVEYVPELRNKLVDCAGYITYGGYNATVEILQSRVPSIIVPRQSGRKMEQFVRAFTFEPYDFFKVMTMQEFGGIKSLVDKIISGYKPNLFTYNLRGTSNTADIISEIYNGC